MEKAQVRADVVKNFKDGKVIIFKKKRRKQYRRTRGHRQELTRVKIVEIISEGKIPPSTPQEEKAKEEKVPKEPEVKKVIAKKETKKEEAEEKREKASKTPTKKKTRIKRASSSKKVRNKEE